MVCDDDTTQADDDDCRGCSGSWQTIITIILFAQVVITSLIPLTIYAFTQQTLAFTIGIHYAVELKPLLLTLFHKVWNLCLQS